MARELLMAGVIATVLVADMRHATACGGCLGLAADSTVITDHRMILSVSREQTTLYDQVRFTGDPESFAWVLPYMGEVEVSVSADRIFAALDLLTSVRVLPPVAPRTCVRVNFTSGAFAPTVEELRREVVGPYEIAQLSADDGADLGAWLAARRYVIPESVSPILAAYQRAGARFLAVKLVPGRDVRDIRPIRITTRGTSLTLPLRMIAAGAGASVGITLWIVGEGRYEPQNFATFVLAEPDILWSSEPFFRSNVDELRAQRTAAGNGRIWEVESSTFIARETFAATVRGRMRDAAADYPTYADAGLDARAHAHAPSPEDDEAADIATLFAGIPSGSERVTRLRADLARSALATDLVLHAAADQAEVPTTRRAMFANPPEVPADVPCSSAAASVQGGCTVAERTSSVFSENAVVLALGSLVAAVTWLGRRARRR